MPDILGALAPLAPGFTLGAFLVIALAAARITRLITTDTLTDPLRLWIARTYESDWVDELFTCPWCMGFWVSLVTVLITLAYPDNPVVTIGVLAFAVSEVVGIIAHLVNFFTKAD